MNTFGDRIGDKLPVRFELFSQKSIPQLPRSTRCLLDGLTKWFAITRSTGEEEKKIKPNRSCWKSRIREHFLIKLRGILPRARSNLSVLFKFLRKTKKPRQTPIPFYRGMEPKQSPWYPQVSPSCSAVWGVFVKCRQYYLGKTERWLKWRSISARIYLTIQCLSSSDSSLEHRWISCSLTLPTISACPMTVDKCCSRWSCLTICGYVWR